MCPEKSRQGKDALSQLTLLTMLALVLTLADLLVRLATELFFFVLFLLRLISTFPSHLEHNHDYGVKYDKGGPRYHKTLEHVIDEL